VFPIFTTLIGILVAAQPAKTSAIKRTFLAIGSDLGAYLALLLCVGVGSMLLAPYQQRNLLRQTAKADDDEIEKLESQFSLDPVSESHEKELKEILLHVKKLVESSRPITFLSTGDRDTIVGHFKELGSVIEEWDASAEVRQMAEQRLDMRFDSELATLGLVKDFNRVALNQLLGWAKQTAVHGGVDKDYKIKWRPYEDEMPDTLMFENGTTAATTDQNDASRTREACQIRIQELVNAMRNWVELTVFSNPILISQYQDAHP